MVSQNFGTKTLHPRIKRKAAHGVCRARTYPACAAGCATLPSGSRAIGACASPSRRHPTKHEHPTNRCRHRRSLAESRAMPYQAVTPYCQCSGARAPTRAAKCLTTPPTPRTPHTTGANRMRGAAARVSYLHPDMHSMRVGGIQAAAVQPCTRYMKSLIDADGRLQSSRHCNPAAA